MKRACFSVTLILTLGMFFADAAFALPVSWTKPRWSDANKEHSNGLWTENYYKDANGNGEWDYGEPWSDSQVEPDWVSANDMSCWMASGANMLSYHGFGDAQTIYTEILGYASYDSRFEWDNGGFQHWAIAEYLAKHNASHKYSLSWYSDGYYSTPGDSGWLADPFEFAKNELYISETVGIALDDPAHAITFWGWDGTDARFADSDQGEGVLHNRTSISGGGTWLLDYNNDNVFSEGVRYIAVLSYVSEPSTLGLLLLGVLGISAMARRNAARRNPWPDR